MSSLAILDKPTTATQEIKRGHIYFADLCFALGHEQGGIRPVLVLQNNIGNRYAPTIIVAVVSSSLTKKNLPTHVSLKAEKCGLQRDSVVFLEQLRTIDKDRVMGYVGNLDESTMEQINRAAQISIGLN